MLSARDPCVGMRIQNSNEPFAIRILTWLAGLASAGMYLSILLVLLKIGPVVMGGERVTRTEWLHIAAPLVAAIGILMAMLCYALASRKPWSRSRNCDVHFDYRLRVN